MSRIPTPTHAILFDWDGTLADTVPLVTKATNEVLLSHGAAVVDEAAIHRGMRFPTAERMLYHLGVSVDDLGPIVRERTDRARAALAQEMAEEFYAVATRLGHEYVTLFPGVREMLQAIDEEGIPMAVVTNNRGEVVRQTLAHMGLSGLLALVVAEEDVRRPKPDPEGVFAAIRALAGRAEFPIDTPRVIFVGDSATDAGAAFAAGVVAVGAGWPGGSIVNGDGNPYKIICHRPEQLVEAIRKGEAA